MSMFDDGYLLRDLRDYCCVVRTLARVCRVFYISEGATP
jgi:hypothetical protein